VSHYRGTTTLSPRTFAVLLHCCGAILSERGAYGHRCRHLLVVWRGKPTMVLAVPMSPPGRQGRPSGHRQNRPRKPDCCAPNVQWRRGIKDINTSRFPTTSLYSWVMVPHVLDLSDLSPVRTVNHNLLQALNGGDE